MIFYIIGIIIILLILYIVFTSNKLIRLNNNVKEAFATMDVYLKKRWDLIPNIVETVKGYATHEKETLNDVVALRNKGYDSLTQDEKIDVNNKLQNNVSKMMLLAESYPDLKANENFKELSNQLVKVEEDIANARKYYNGTVRDFNNKVEMFPSNIIAHLFRYQTKNMFEASEIEKSNVHIEL